jgi:purine-cytosine permease-like protein
VGAAFDRYEQPPRGRGPDDGCPTMTAVVEDVHAELIERGVPRHLQTMTTRRSSGVISRNLAPAAWVLGAIVAGVGLDVRTGLIAVVLGNVLGAIPVGLCATISPWAGIVITNWFVFRDHHGAPRRWAPGATVFVVVTILTIGLFSSTQVYTGPVARLLGGTDIGYFVGFFAAAGGYLLVERAQLRRIARRPAAAPWRSAPQPEGLIG